MTQELDKAVVDRVILLLEERDAMPFAAPIVDQILATLDPAAVESGKIQYETILVERAVQAQKIPQFAAVPSRTTRIRRRR